MEKGMEKGHRRPPLQKEATIREIGSGIYNISSPPVGFQEYLIPGKEKALLIDTGMGIDSIRKVVETVTSLPVIVVTTHCHPDHAGGNAEFGPALFNPAELDVFRAMTTVEFRTDDVSHMPGEINWTEHLQPQGPEPVPAQDGQILDIGGREFQIIFTPGHTHGSLCVFEEATGTLFTGDNVMPRTTAVREWNASTVEELYESLKKLSKLPVRRILTGHMPNDCTPDVLEREIICAEHILAGAQGEPRDFRGQTTYLYEYEGVSIEYRADNIHKS